MPKSALLSRAEAEAVAVVALQRARRKADVRRLTFREFASRVNPRLQWYRHTARLAAVLQRVADGELKRVMVFMPPRHGKSLEVSRLFSAYYLDRHPAQWVGLSSYGADLAWGHSRAARDYYLQAGGALDPSAGAVNNWETLAHGGMWAAGVGGPITGRGFDLGIIDDPIKNAADAASERFREGQREWYRSTFYSRQEPDAAIVIIQTRWNQEDLGGWLLSEEANDDEQPERWHIVNFPAIKEVEPGEALFPPTCTVEPDWRESGEALCPERYPLPKLLKFMARLGSYFWGALFQQRPTPLGGALFRREWFAIVDAVSAGARRLRYWDLAATENSDSDWTAAPLLALADGVWFIADMRHLRGSPGAVEALVKQTAELDGRSVPIRIEQEPGASGVNTIYHYQRRVLVGYNVRGDRATGNKIERMRPLAAAAEAGNVKLLRGPWNAAFLSEAEAVPFGEHDDMCDAVAGAMACLSAGKRPFGWYDEIERKEDAA